MEELKSKNHKSKLYLPDSYELHVEYVSKAVALSPVLAFVAAKHILGDIAAKASPCLFTSFTGYGSQPAIPIDSCLLIFTSL